jgi:Arc/MetJ-type ribon-helix-helix transcriptional regulator
MAHSYAECMAQVVVRLDDALTAALDDLVREGVVASRSSAVREGLALLIEQRRRSDIAARIVNGYTRVPQQAAELGWSDDATRAMIADEPW